MITATDPNQIALQLTGRDYISYSALSTFRQCPLRYFFKYVLGLPELFVSASLVCGAAIHRAVEAHFQALLAGQPPPTLAQLLSVYREAWQERNDAEVRFGKSEDADSLVELAERMLAAFQASAAANPVGTIIGIEEELRGQVVEGVPDLLARVDLLVEDGDALVVSDLKTSRSRWSPQQAEDSAEQLLLYSQLAKRLQPGKSLRLEFLVLTKAKQPSVETHRVTLDPHRIARTKQVVRNVWQAIRSGTVYPSPSPMNCGSCPFQLPCREWAG